MNLTEENIEQLESFWNGTLPEPEARALERRLATDEAFRRAAHHLRLTLLGLEGLREQRLRRWMDDTDTTLPPVPPLPVAKPFVDWNWWIYNARPAAAAAFLALAFCAWWLLQPGQTAEQRLVSEAFEPYPMYGITLSSEAEQLKMDAFNAYKDKKYKKSAGLFQTSFQNNGDSLMLFYSGLSHLGAGQTPQAIEILEGLRHADSVPKEAAHWYLALAYVAAQRPLEAKTFLTELSHTDGPYRQKALDFLEEMNQVIDKTSSE